MHLRCTFKSVNFWEIGQLYGCTGTFAADSISASGYIIEVTGSHESGKTNDDVRGLLMKNQQSPFIPKGIAQFFPNLEAFWSENCGFTRISKKDFEPFRKLKQVHFYMNKIETLDADLFLANPMIQHISFARNPLKHVDLGTFDGLKDLRSLYLHDAGCINDGSAINNRAKVITLIDQLKTSCPPSTRSEKSLDGIKSLDEFDENFVKMIWKIIEMDYTVAQQEDRMRSFEREMKKISLANLY